MKKTVLLPIANSIIKTGKQSVCGKTCTGSAAKNQPHEQGLRGISPQSTLRNTKGRGRQGKKRGKQASILFIFFLSFLRVP
jgi:hypothetical protein